MRLSNVRLPDGSIQDVVIEKWGVIKAIEAPKEKLPKGMFPLLLLPGLIDPHVHDRTPGGEHKETVEDVIQAAVCGGVTTVFVMPNTDPTITTEERLKAKEALIAEAPITYRQWFGATPTNAKERARASQYPIVPGFKMCTTHTTGTDPSFIVKDTEDIRNVLRENAARGMITAAHIESHSCIQENLVKLGHAPRIQDHGVIRSTEAEISDIARVLKIQQETSAPIYICHVSTPEGLELIYSAKRRGAKVYTEVCPHHWVLSDDLLTKENPGFYKMNPPLRSREQMMRMQQLLCTEGYVDCIASDHAPHTIEEKMLSDYNATPSGVPGVQTIFPLTYSFVAEGKMSLRHFINLTSRNAVRIFNLDRKGVIRPGAEADLILVDQYAEYKIRNQDMRSKCGWTPFDGMTVKGKVVTTIAKGKVLYRA